MYVHVYVFIYTFYYVTDNNLVKTMYLNYFLLLNHSY